MTDRRVALLRGINVGTAKRIAMADLRALFEDLGYQDVKTLLNSGNVVYTAPGKSRGDETSRIEKAITDRLGVTTRVIVLDGSEVAAAVGKNPLGPVARDPSHTLLVFLRDAEIATRLKPLLRQSWTPEAMKLGPRVAYLWCAGGLHESPLWTAVGRVAGDACTARNQATMAKLLALVEGS